MHNTKTQSAAYEVFAVKLLTTLEKINTTIGKISCWLALGCALVCFFVVVLRYVFDIGIIWLQELYIWQHAFLFLIGAGPAYTENKHVRVDLLTENRGARTRALLEMAGVVFLLIPFLGCIAYFSWGFVAISWATGETTGQSGGLFGVYVLKSALLFFVVFLALQGIASLLRNLLILSNCQIVPPAQTAGEH